MKRIAGIILALLMTVTCCQMDMCFAEDYDLEIDGHVEGRSKQGIAVHLSWNKVSKARRYVVYRSDPVSSQNKALFGKVKRKKIATVTGRSFTNRGLKFKKWYSYDVRAYSKKKGGKLIDHCKYAAYTGVGTPEWEEYLWVDGYTSPKRIDLLICDEYGLAPDGYLIYRKTGKGHYKKTADVKRKKYYTKWKDKKVKRGKAYYYKTKAYRKINGKRIYSHFSEKLHKSAVYQVGRYTISNIQGLDSSDAKYLSFTVRSNKGNGSLVMDAGDWEISGYDMYDEYGTDKTMYDVILFEFSKDKVHWKNMVDKCTVKAGEEFHIRISRTDGQPINVKKDEYGGAEVILSSIHYNGFHSSVIDFDLKAKTSSARVDDEEYH